MSLGIINDATLSSIARAIRIKNSDVGQMRPSEMAAAILDITGGGGGEATTLTGDIGYLCARGTTSGIPFTQNNLYKWIKSKCEGITACQYAFVGMKNADVIREINFSGHPSYNSLFYDSDLTVFPKITGDASGTLTGLFDGNITTLDRTVLEDAELTTTTLTNDHETWRAEKTGISLNNMVSPASLIEDCEDLVRYLCENYSPTAITGMYSNCRRLRKAIIPVVCAKITSQTYLQGVVSGGISLEEIEFMNGVSATNYFGHPHIDNTSYPQTWNFVTSNIGYYPSTGATIPVAFTEAGFTVDNRVIDEESYQRLKDSDFWWSGVPEYSKWNLDSVEKLVETIPSPASSGTITFNGECGSAFGKAIKDISQETISKFVERRWTVAIQ